MPNGKFEQSPSMEKAPDPQERYGAWSLRKKEEGTPESLAEAEQADKLWEAIRILRGINYWEAANDSDLKRIAERALEVVQETRDKYPEVAELTTPAVERVSPWSRGSTQEERKLEAKWLTEIKAREEEKRGEK